MSAAVGAMAALVGGACAGTPRVPRELIAARAAYVRAAGGSAAQVNGGQLRVAKEALAVAEQSFGAAPAQTVRDRAYVAMRKAEAAEVMATAVEAAMRRDRALLELAVLQVHAPPGAAPRSEGPSADVSESLQALMKAGTVTQESRGVVVTLPADTLFAKAAEDFLPDASVLLDAAATAIKAADGDGPVIIEAHTDDRGSPSVRARLTMARAEALRRALVSRGVEAGRLTARGLAALRPLSDNDTSEGRARNRRVEIIISGPTSARTAQLP